MFRGHRYALCDIDENRKAIDVINYGDNYEELEKLWEVYHAEFLEFPDNYYDVAIFEIVEVTRKK